MTQFYWAFNFFQSGYSYIDCIQLRRFWGWDLFMWSRFKEKHVTPSYLSECLTSQYKVSSLKPTLIHTVTSVQGCLTSFHPFHVFYAIPLRPLCVHFCNIWHHYSHGVDPHLSNFKIYQTVAPLSRRVSLGLSKHLKTPFPSLIQPCRIPQAVPLLLGGITYFTCNTGFIASYR